MAETLDISIRWVARSTSLSDCAAKAVESLQVVRSVAEAFGGWKSGGPKAKSVVIAHGPLQELLLAERPRDETDRVMSGSPWLLEIYCRALDSATSGSGFAIFRLCSATIADSIFFRPVSGCLHYRSDCLAWACSQSERHPTLPMMHTLPAREDNRC